MFQKDSTSRVFLIWFAPLVLLVGILAWFARLSNEQQKPSDWRSDLESVRQTRQQQKTTKTESLFQKSLDGTLSNGEKINFVRFITDRVDELTRTGKHGLYSGTITEDGPGGLMRYQNATSGISFLFQEDFWDIQEEPEFNRPTSVSTIYIRHDYGRLIEIHLTDSPGYGEERRGTKYLWDQAIENYGTPAQTEVGNEIAFIFTDVQTSTIDLGIPVFGNIVYVPSKHALIITTAYDIDTSNYTKVIESLTFEE